MNDYVVCTIKMLLLLLLMMMMRKAVNPSLFFLFLSVVLHAYMVSKHAL